MYEKNSISLSPLLDFAPKWNSDSCHIVTIHCDKMIIIALYLRIHISGRRSSRFVPEYIIIEIPSFKEYMREYDGFGGISYTKLHPSYIFIYLKKGVYSFSFCTANFLDFWLALRRSFFLNFLPFMERVSLGVVSTDTEAIEIGELMLGLSTWYLKSFYIFYQ